MPSNEERRQAAREKLARQNERREAEARKRKITAIGISAAVVVALVAAGCYIWLPQGPRAPLRVGAENRFKSTHTTCTYADRDAAGDARKNIDEQPKQLAENRKQLADRIAALPPEQRDTMKDQIAAANEQLDEAQKAADELAKKRPQIDQMAERNKTVSKPDGKDVPTTGTLPGTITTDQGAIGYELDRSKAPCNVETFVTLIQAKYFDNTPCHRETANKGDGRSKGLFVLQCGDPSGTGVGGPNWTSPDETPTFLQGDASPNQLGQTPSVVYPAGTIAVANSNQQPNPQTGQNGTFNTGSSQFFLVYQDSTLPASYSVIGKLDDAGLKVVQEIAKKGITWVPNPNAQKPKPGQPATDGRPTQPVNITSMTLAS
ncbi:peptidylprolyl isomerase [Tsukamurella strandjordii]|uniref:Peptidylprolyl isomerase n=1 Tax=Tsukamurella strandjordii TaxID=147577 RepID=A0AA90NFS2_9ACTN|nr:peptidylprolyl isomerase [Tsukamurella strandjordii]MDP0397571.1 peptidylprolyl isomerase [Tsukamurella strandjordii]